MEKYPANKTAPWHEKELIRVNGHGLVYRFDADENLVVMMPGWGGVGMSAPVSARALKNFGFDVEYPRIVRR
jgi:hypothetical protein